MNDGVDSCQGFTVNSDFSLQFMRPGVSRDQLSVVPTLGQPPSPDQPQILDWQTELGVVARLYGGGRIFTFWADRRLVRIRRSTAPSKCRTTTPTPSPRGAAVGGARSCSRSRAGETSRCTRRRSTSRSGRAGCRPGAVWEDDPAGGVPRGRPSPAVRGHLAAPARPRTAGDAGAGDPGCARTPSTATHPPACPSQARAAAGSSWRSTMSRRGDATPVPVQAIVLLRESTGVGVRLQRVDTMDAHPRPVDAGVPAARSRMTAAARFSRWPRLPIVSLYGPVQAPDYEPPPGRGGNGGGAVRDLSGGHQLKLSAKLRRRLPIVRWYLVVRIRTEREPLPKLAARIGHWGRPRRAAARTPAGLAGRSKRCTLAGARAASSTRSCSTGCCANRATRRSW